MIEDPEPDDGNPDLIEAMRDAERQLRLCIHCGALCDHRVQVCECDPAVCPLPPVQRG